MYSGSRGILYTAPPAADESTDENADAAAAKPAGDAAVTDAAADEQLTADD